MSEPQTEEMPANEAVANVYRYFIETLEILAADADTQCKRMSNYNVAWEIKDVVSRGISLLDLPGGDLSSRQKNEVVDEFSSYGSLQAASGMQPAA